MAGSEWKDPQNGRDDTPEYAVAIREKRIAELEVERDGWLQSATEFCTNMEYYRTGDCNFSVPAIDRVIPASVQFEFRPTLDVEGNTCPCWTPKEATDATME